MFDETRQILREHDIRPDRRIGQQQVIDYVFLERMVDYAKLSKKDVVLEIGAGIGNLTMLLARHAGGVIAVERDAKLIKALQERLEAVTNVKFLHGDALRVELSNFNKIVSNLPYSISSNIMFRLLEFKFDLAVLMFQKEFAERLAAKPGSENYGRLTVNTCYRAEVELLDEVPPTAFFPQPKVNSAIVRLRPHDPPFEVKDEQMFSNVVRALFQHRRQRVRNALMRSFTEVFADNKPKSERRSFADKRLPKRLTEARVMDLAPENFGEIANLLTSP
ncbi:MAG: 16S rRNA (adenine(1518)-N(6)/adenine(1519)-N(6))-dimethyltransferase RsmA [Methanobacteriota archaeon]